jgi:Ca2+-binding EF-hand superfamily protein
MKPFVAVVLLTVAPAVWADEPAKPAAETLFAELDADKDGQVASDEIPEAKKSLFERLVRRGDKNADGKLAAEEFAAGLAEGAAGEKPARGEGRPGAGGGPARFFARLDSNADGKIVADEVPEPGRERFAKLVSRADKDGDGAVSREEFLAAGPPDGPRPRTAEAAAPAESKPAAAPEAAKPAAPANEAKKAKKPKKPGKAKPAEGAAKAEKLFQRLDANGDGKLTGDEAPEERQKMIARLVERGDANADGGLSLEEFRAVFVDRQAARVAKPGQPAAAAPAGGLYGAIDADRDGQLSTEEIAAAAEAIRKLDANGDGKITVREVSVNMNRKKQNK